MRPLDAVSRSRPAVRRSRPLQLAIWLFGKVLAVGILVAGAWTLVRGAEEARLRVSLVQVRGQELVPADEIRLALDVEGTNVFAIRSARLERRLQANPAVEKARIEPRFPDVVRVTVVERRPAAVWDAGGRRTLVDATGLAFREAGDTGSAQLAIVAAPEGPFVAVGERVTPDAIHIAQSIAPRLNALGLAGARLEYRPSSGVTIVAAHKVAIGFEADLEAKLAAYQTIRRHLDQTKTTADLVDVRFLERPYYR